MPVVCFLKTTTRTDFSFHYSPNAYFWLKALAIRDGERWRLCYYSLSGRWSDTMPPGMVEIDEQQATISVVSRLIDAATAWKQVESLAENTLQLAP